MDTQHEVLIPKWMGQEGAAPERVTSDSFLDKSLFTLARTLALFNRPPPRSPTPVGIAASRLASALLAITLLSLSVNPAFTALYAAILLSLLATRKAATIAFILKGAVPSAFIAAVVLLPAFLWGHAQHAVLLPVKTFCSVATVLLVTSQTRWESLFASLSLFRVPDLIILILDIALKHIAILGKYAVNLLEALKLRSVGSNPQRRDSFSGIAGTLFLRSSQAARTLHEAMECRGFTGSYRPRRSITWSISVFFYLALDAGIGILWLKAGNA